MAEQAKTRFRIGEHRGHRRPWWKRMFRRGSSEDLIEYVSRMAVGPLFLVSVVLVYGLSLEPSERREYVESLTNPGRWFTSDEPVESSGSLRPLTVPTPVPVEPSPAADPAVDPAAGDSAAAPADTSTAAADPGVQADGTWIVVQRGQTLYDIARSAYGDVSQWKRIWFYNLERLPKPEAVKYGMEIFIPPPGDLSTAELQRVDELMSSSS